MVERIPFGASSVQQVRSADDLPDPVDGRHQLEDGTAYMFTEFVTSTSSLEPGNASPILAPHGSLGGFVHVGGGSAIVGSGDVFMKNVYVHAPGGTIFDVSADQTTEMLVESCAFSDAKDTGDIASLGTIDGYRVPAFKGCNFEDFQGGFTWDGSPDKIFFEGCPFRNVGSTRIHTLASTLDVDLFKLSTDCYVKDVQPGTEVVHVEAGGSPDNYLKFINVDLLDPDLQEANVLTGALTQRDDNVVVNDSFPLVNSRVSGDLSLDASTTVTGSGAGITSVSGANIASATTLNVAERVESTTDGLLTYTAIEPRDNTVHGAASVSGSNTTFAVYLMQNGAAIPHTRRVGFLNSGSAIANVTAIGDVTLNEGDTFSLAIENEGGTTDLTVETMNLVV